MSTEENPKDELISSNDEIDTIGFVLTVLKKHEKEFDRLITRLAKITEQLRETKRMLRRIDEIDEKIEALRAEISNATKCHPFEK
jgi:tetrahydromethanopterin S-methyltransferase subunit G